MQNPAHSLETTSGFLMSNPGLRLLRIPTVLPSTPLTRRRPSSVVHVVVVAEELLGVP